MLAKAADLEPCVPESHSGLPLASCAAMGKFLTLLVIPFLYLENVDDDNNVHLVRNLTGPFHEMWAIII